VTSPASQVDRPEAASRWQKWRRRAIYAALVYLAVCLAVWAMAETDYRRVFAGDKPFFAHYRAGAADGGSVDYWGPCYSYLLVAAHSYAGPRPEWGHSDGWAYDDGVMLSYPLHLLPLNFFAKESLRIVPGGCAGEMTPVLFLEIESWDRIYVYSPDLPEDTRPRPLARAEADKVIAGLQSRLLPVAQVTLAKGIGNRGRGLDAVMDEVQAWLAGHNISRITFRVPRDGETFVVREIGATQGTAK
jgi:hypothetical protein